MSRLAVSLPTFLLGTLLSSWSFADWQLDNQLSSVSFVSIKAGNIAETHRFTEMSGSVSPDNMATVQINSASVDTLIPIRDERMREFLFQSPLFPNISVNAKLPAEVMDTIKASTPSQHTVPVTLTIRDTTLDLQAKLLVVPADPETIVVSTTAPILLNAGTVGLTAGVEKLRELAGLPSISQAVPVTVSLVYRRDRQDNTP